MKNILVKIIITCSILLAVNISLSAQNIEAFKIYYLPDSIDILWPHMDDWQRDTIYTDPCLINGFYELNGKTYFSHNGAILILDESTGKIDTISEMIDTAEEIVNINRTFGTSGFSESIIHYPYSNSLAFFTNKNEFQYENGLVMFNTDEIYPEQMYLEEMWRENKSNFFAFPQKELEAEYTPNDAMMLYSSTNYRGETYQFRMKTLDTMIIIDSVEYPEDYIFDNKTLPPVLIDTFKLLWADYDTLRTIDLKAKEIKAMFSIEGDTTDYNNSFFIFANKVDKIADLKHHILKRTDTTLKNIPYFVFENNKLTRMSDIDLTNNTWYEKIKNINVDDIDKNGNFVETIPLTTMLETDIKFWNNDEIIIRSHITENDPDSYEKNILSIMDSLRRSFMIYNFNTGESKEFTIPKELFTRVDFDDYYYINGRYMRQFIQINTLSDGIRKGFLFRNVYNQSKGCIFVIYDPRKDTINNISELTSIENTKISPNPTNAEATLTLNLQESGNLRIILNNLLGQELFEIHNKFEDSGSFTKTFSTSNLPKGTYYLKIFIGKDIKIEKIVVN